MGGGASIPVDCVLKWFVEAAKSRLQRQRGEGEGGEEAVRDDGGEGSAVPQDPATVTGSHDGSSDTQTDALKYPRSECGGIWKADEGKEYSGVSDAGQRH
jgi:hypothetical protein